MSDSIPPGYKMTEVGIIPEDWDVKPLSKICNSIVDGTHYTPNYVDAGVAFYSVENVVANNFTDTKFITEEEHTKLTKRCKPQKGDILLTRIGTLGKTKLIDWDVNASIYVSLALFKLSNEVVPTYLYRYTQSSQFVADVEKRSLLNATPIKINMENIGSIPIPVPQNPNEQRAIANTLSEVDAEITALDEAIAKKRDLKQGAMQRLLTGKERLPGFSGAWEVKRLGSFISDFRGGAPLKPSDFTEHGFKVLPKGGIVRGGILKIEDEDQQFCSEKYAESHRNNVVENKYTIVVLRDLVPSGPTIGLMVKIPSSDKYVLAQGVYGFIVDEQEVFADYLIHLSNTKEYRYLMQSIMVGSTQVHITNTAFKEIEFDFPPLEEQEAIAAVLSDMDAEISALEEQREKTVALKQGMMQELLTGKTRLV